MTKCPPPRNTLPNRKGISLFLGGTGCPNSLKMVFMAYLPKGIRTVGSTSSISLRRKGRHDPISALSGFLQCGRGHLRRLVRKKSFLVYPPVDRSSSSTFPEGPVNILPLSISCLFGAWAIIINPEERDPSPGTTIFLKDEMEHK